MKSRTTKQTLLAYSAMEEYELEEYRDRIEALYSDIELQIERVSTAELLRRLLSEGESGSWDIVLGLALTTMTHPVVQALFGKLEFPELNRLPKSVVDPLQRWFCPSAFVPAFCVDPGSLKQKRLAIPTSWEELASGRYKNLIAIPDPSYSGAGFLHLTSLRQFSGEASAWSVLTRIAHNNPKIVRSAFAPCAAVGNGEAAIGVTVTIAATRMARMGLPLQMQIPTDAAGYEPEGFALRAGTTKHEAASRVLRWMLTPEACSIYQKYHKCILVDSTALVTELSSVTVHQIDTGEATRSREETCARWSRLFSRS